MRVTDELRAEIEELATKENRSLSSWIETTLKRAVEGAKRYVTDALHAAYPIGNGRGPLHHLFRFEPSVTQ